MHRRQLGSRFIVRWDVAPIPDPRPLGRELPTRPLSASQGAPKDRLFAARIWAKFTDGRSATAMRCGRSRATEPLAGGSRMNFKKDAPTDHGRKRRSEAGTIREALQEALDLAVQIDRLLTNPRATMTDVDTFR